MQMIGRKWNFIIVLVLVAVFLFSVPLQAAETDDNSLGLFKEVFQYTLDKYVDELDEKTLEEMAIKGLMQQLDPYSQYFNEEEYDEFQTEMDGFFGGVGLRIEKIGDYITVVAPLAGTPGEKAGILAGDIIFKVDETELTGMTLQKAVELIRGEAGSVVKLTIVREGVTEHLVFNVTRDTIEIKVIESEMLEGQIGYISVNSFTSSSPILYSHALNILRSQGAKSIILDLRNNPGGLLGAALSVVSPFIDEGKDLLHIESRAEQDNTYFSTSGSIGLPLVVLVNKGSASGSEIVAGAVQDHGVGTLVGTTTFGKATVQHMHELSNGSGLKLTTSKYLTPKKRAIHGVGIEPDVIVEDPEEQLKMAIEILKGNTVFLPSSQDLTIKIGSKTMWQAGNSVSLSEAPYMANGYVTMVPLRQIAEQLDFRVDFNTQEQKITLTKLEQEMEMWLDKKGVLVNGQTKSVEAEPVIINGTSMVPLRVVAEFFGTEVQWKDGEITLIIK